MFKGTQEIVAINEGQLSWWNQQIRGSCCPSKITYQNPKSLALDSVNQAAWPFSVPLNLSGTFQVVVVHPLGYFSIFPLLFLVMNLWTLWPARRKKEAEFLNLILCSRIHVDCLILLKKQSCSIFSRSNRGRHDFHYRSCRQALKWHQLQLYQCSQAGL